MPVLETTNTFAVPPTPISTLPSPAGILTLLVPFDIVEPTDNTSYDISPDVLL